MKQSVKPELPVGYWLKRADQLLTEKINQAQAANGVSRTEWQILNNLYETGGANWGELYETMQAFVDLNTLDQILNRLVERGWVEVLPERNYRLSELGIQQHQRILTTETEIRKQAMQGITPEEYSTTVSVLQRMVENLEDLGLGDE